MATPVGAVLTPGGYGEGKKAEEDARASDWQAVELSIARNKELLARRHADQHVLHPASTTRRPSGSFLTPKRNRGIAPTDADNDLRIVRPPAVPAAFARRGRRTPHGRQCTQRNLCMASAFVAFMLAVWSIAVLILSLDPPLAHHRRAGPPLPPGARPRNIIFMVSDGMGLSHITLARMHKAAMSHTAAVAAESSSEPRLQDASPPATASLHLDSFATGHVHTYSASSLVTDSAAGATAWSCGRKTDNHFVAVEPLHYTPCATLMEAAKAAGMATGVAVTSSVTDATPAAFASHARHRKLEYSIALQYAVNRTVDVILGGGATFFAPEALSILTGSPPAARDAADHHAGVGFAFANDRASLAAARSAPLLGLFADVHLPWEIDRDPSVTPSLAEMARKAVELLSARSHRDGDTGFMLLIEGSKIDKAAHPNDAPSVVREVLAYDEAVGAMLDFAREDGETLVVCTSDHETGGLSLGRGVIKAPTAANGAPDEATAAFDELFPEAPLRERSFLGEANGWMEQVYGYDVALIGRINKSAEAIAEEAYAAAGSPAPALLSTNAAAREALVERLAGSMARAGLEAPLLAQERGMLLRVAARFEQLGEYGIVRAVGAVISSRAKIGWTTFGHTGSDVILYAFGPGSEMLRGSMENTAVGRAIEELMGWSLDDLSTQLGTPLIADQDRNGSYKAFAEWTPWTPETRPREADG